MMLSFMPLVLRGQEADSTSTRQKAQESVLGYRMISRYRPENKEFSAGGILGNSWVSVSGSYFRPYADYYGMGPLASVGMGKWFTHYPSEAQIARARKLGRDPSSLLQHYHGIFLAAGAGYFRDNYYGERVKTFHARVSYLFDLSSYVAGYNPQRPVSLVAVAGFGLSYGKASGDSKGSVSPGFHAGVQITSHILPNTDIFIEPLFEIQKEARNLVRMDIWRRYLPVFKGSVGVSYSLDRSYHPSDPGYDWRFSISGGVVVKPTEGVGVVESAGPCYSIGVGRAYSEYFRWRLSLGAYMPAWGGVYSSEGLQIKKGSYLYARMDAMYDILHLFSEAKGFEIDIMGGPEAGRMKKTGSGMSTEYYIGFGGGVRLMWNPRPDLGLFVEPRLSILPYQTHSNSHGIKYANYIDKLTSLSLGLEYRLFRK